MTKYGINKSKLKIKHAIDKDNVALMNTHNTPILSSNQNHLLHHTFYVPTGDIKASLLIIHNLAEHSGRYENVARYLADRGVLVLTYDQLGHGQTIKDAHELGFIDKSHPIQLLSKDVVLMMGVLKQYTKQVLVSRDDGKYSVPCFVMGQGFGATLAQVVLAHHATSVQGAILLGVSTGGKLTYSLELALSLANLYNPAGRNRRLMQLIQHYLLSKLATPISPSLWAWLTENVASTQAVETDPLSGYVPTNNGLWTAYLLLNKAHRLNWYERLASDYPLLLMSGANDPVGNMGQDVIKLQEVLGRAGKQAVSVRLYPNMRHEPLQEMGCAKVYDEIATWIEYHSEKASK